MPKVLWGRKEPNELYQDYGQVSPIPSQNDVANQALSEAFVTNDPASYSARVNAKKQGVTIQDGALDALYEYIANQELEGFVALNRNLPMDEQVTIARALIDNDVDFRKVTRTNVLLFMLFSEGYGDVPMANFNEWAKKQSDFTVDSFVAEHSRVSRQRMFEELDEVVATLGFTGGVDVVANIITQDFIPVYAEITRSLFNRDLLEAVRGKPPEEWRSWLSGEARQIIRDTLVAAAPLERKQMINDMVRVVNKYRSDPKHQLLITKYGILEALEAIQTDGVLMGTSGDNNLDRFVSNFAFFVEGWFGFRIVGSLGKTMKGAMRATDALKARQVANASRQSKAASQLDDSLTDPSFAVEMGLEVDDALPAVLPKPPTLVDDLDILPNGSKEVLIRSQRASSKILEETDALTGSGLDAFDKNAAIRKTIDDLDVADNMEIQHKMTVVRSLPNDNGFSLRVVVGDGPDGGWDNLQDLLDEVVELDPNLDVFQVYRRSKEGGLEEVFESQSDYLKTLTGVQRLPARDEPFFYAGIKVTDLEDADLVRISKTETDPQILEAIEKEAVRRAQTAPLKEEYFLVYEQKRFWHSTDKIAFDPQTVQSGGILPRSFIAPNARFGGDFYNNVLNSYRIEQGLDKDFNILLKPYYDLGVEDTRFVNSVFEWSEEFGKENGRAPVMSEIYSRYDGITEDQVSGIIALREAMDTLYQLYNRRLYREWQALGYSTARTTQSDLPSYHGLALTREQAKSGHYLDPVTGDLVRLDNKSLDDLYNTGGQVMKLDMGIDVPNVAKAKVDQVLIDGRNYKVGDLSTSPLTYYPGYTFRFHDDPYFIVKETSGVSLNGASQGPKHVESEAVRTAGTQFEADQWVRRATKALAKRGDTDSTFKVIRARDITQTESVLLQKETLNREGRLFWDDRSFDRLPDVNGNRARLEDPVMSLERGIALASRQTTSEDLLRSYKNAFENQYSDLVEPGVFANSTLSEVVKRLRNQRANTADSALRNRINDAIEIVKYFRLMEGTEGTLIPLMREGTINLATAISHALRGSVPTRSIEKWAQTMDPTRSMRTLAFNVFMVFRPVRQALLQSAQIAYIAPLKPTYVASGAIFKDAIMLRSGLTKFRKSAFDDGFSVGRAAKSMGLSKAEYRKLVKEFDRSAIVDLVDVHSFAGGARKSRRLELPKTQVGIVGYKAKQMGVEVREWMQRWGFDFGERNNMTFSYLMALKRHMDNKGYKSVLNVPQSEWDDIAVDASNLGLGMVRPNNFGYQTGALGVMTQFLSFQHKAALGLLAQNPAISKRDALKIFAGTTLLYGAGMFGARDMVRENLSALGLDEWVDKEVPGLDGVTVLDYLSGGLVENIFNDMGQALDEEWKDIDLEFFAPGIGVERIWEDQITLLASQPGKVIFGPFGSTASKIMDSFNFINWYMEGAEDQPPLEKAQVTLDYALRGLLPAYNDVNRAWVAYKLNQWVTQAGEPIDIEASLNSVLARGLLGARTRDEMAYHRLQDKKWDSDSRYQDIIRANKRYLSTLITQYGDGDINRKDFEMQVRFLTNLMEDFPEHRKAQVLKASLIENFEDGSPSVAKQLIQMMKKGQLGPEAISLIDSLENAPRELKDYAKEVWERQGIVEAEVERRLEERKP